MAHTNNDRPKTQVTFERDLGFFDATMIGVGAMIGAGIFVLTGMASGVAGPAAILSFALNGIVTLFTAFSYAELASAIPEAGGGYSYIKRAFPPWIGFLSGSRMSTLASIFSKASSTEIIYSLQLNNFFGSCQIIRCIDIKPAQMIRIERIHLVFFYVANLHLIEKVPDL